MMNLWLIPFFPLAGFAINGLAGRRLPKSAINAVAVGSVLLSFVWVIRVLLGLNLPVSDALVHPHVERYFTWIQSGAINIGFDLVVDRLSAVMLLIVTGVGLLIHIYAVGYMAHEGGYYRFFSYLNLFMFFMLILVLGANYLVMFVGWEGVGLCSYLLIGFYFLTNVASTAANKAFIVNRIGDFGFSLAMFLIFVNVGSLDFGQVMAKGATLPTGLLTAICLLLFLGATGKSAQVPLYVWLPDAMAGPTPVSALIHAATMVTAGVYMVARSAPLFIHAPIAMDIVAYIGLLTAVMAATIGLAQNDIKKVFAYSTVSQLGYMFLGLGAGAFSAGIYHVMTHAFFKALLFLGAGSVIHALSGEQDLRHMGGLLKKTPITAWTLFIASLAIAGVPGLSGFYSKDEILVAAYHHAPWMYWVGTITAGMTAFYVFRAWFMAFLGKPRGHHHPHESPLVMTGPLMILAVLSVIGGFAFKVPHFLEPLFGEVKEAEDPSLVIYSVAAGLIGIGLAYVFYVLRPGLPDKVARSFSFLYTGIYNKYFVDEAYDAVVVRPLVDGSRDLLWKGVDAGLIDGAVNGLGRESRRLGGILRMLQGGNIRSYAAYVLLGSIIVIIAFSFGGGAR
jgi:NADH-quinone oxidoreductase subunit L